MIWNDHDKHCKSIDTYCQALRDVRRTENSITNKTILVTVLLLQRIRSSQVTSHTKITISKYGIQLLRGNFCYNKTRIGDAKAEDSLPCLYTFPVPLHHPLNYLSFSYTTCPSQLLLASAPRAAATDVSWESFGHPQILTLERLSALLQLSQNLLTLLTGALEAANL